LSFEKNLLIALLKLSQDGSVKQKDVSFEAHIPLSVTLNLLKKLQNENFIYLGDNSIEVNSEYRLQLAIKAMGLGADIKDICDFLRWQEFEAIAAHSLELNCYVTKKNVRFKHDGKRWEIDVVGCRKPLVMCIDCKHWRRGISPSVVRKMAIAQSLRVKAFAASFPIAAANFECLKWQSAKFIPIILSLVPFREKFIEGVPVVPVLTLRDFIDQLPLNVELTHYIQRKLGHSRNLNT